VQDRVRELESEIEWVRAERQDAQQAAQREQKQAQARIKEAEDAAARAKAARRSVQPRLTAYNYMHSLQPCMHRILSDSPQWNMLSLHMLDKVCCGKEAAAFCMTVGGLLVNVVNIVQRCQPLLTSQSFT